MVCPVCKCVCETQRERERERGGIKLRQRGQEQKYKPLTQVTSSRLVGGCVCLGCGRFNIGTLRHTRTRTHTQWTFHSFNKSPPLVSPIAAAPLPVFDLLLEQEVGRCCNTPSCSSNDASRHLLIPFVRARIYTLHNNRTTRKGRAGVKSFRCLLQEAVVQPLCLLESTPSQSGGTEGGGTIITGAVYSKMGWTAQVDKIWEPFLALLRTAF